jgi:PhnB protein
MAETQPPEGYHSVQPYLIVKDATGLMDFMKAAFGATERMRMGPPDGGVMHAEMDVGDSVIMLSDATPQFGPMPATMVVYVDDCDRVYKQALAAGASSEREPADQFYGDRTAGVNDAFGNKWWIHTHIENVPPDEMERRMAAQQA